MSLSWWSTEASPFLQSASTAGGAGPHSSKQGSSSEERHDNPAIAESEFFLAAQSWPSPEPQCGTQSHTEQAGPCVLSWQGLDQACCQLQVPQPDDWLRPLLPFLAPLLSCEVLLGLSHIPKPGAGALDQDNPGKEGAQPLIRESPRVCTVSCPV